MLSARLQPCGQHSTKLIFEMPADAVVIVSVSLACKSDVLLVLNVGDVITGVWLALGPQILQNLNVVRTVASVRTTFVEIKNSS